MRQTVHCRVSRLGLTLVLAGLMAALLAAGALAQGQQRLVVYTYDSFASGPAQAIKDGFEALHPGVEVVFVAPGSSGEALARVIAELNAGGSDADVLIGISDTQLSRAIDQGVFMKLDRSRLPNLAKVPAHLDFDATGHVVPFDHGYVTIIYDSRVLGVDELPQTLEDLTDPRFRGKLIAIDPRTSSVGHAFLMWTIAEYGDPGYLEYWERLLPSLLTVTGGWSAAYSQYEAGEAPMMVSYSTDTAAGIYYAGSDHSRVLTPKGQAYQQIEAAGIVAGTDVPELAHLFLNYLLSEEVQSLIPTTNWMFPVNAETPLPDFFAEYAVIPENPVRLDGRLIEENEQRWLREWARLITGQR
ncbi:MAG TPA: thiamine ABC transporter substrate-binding protein [Limnochordales bacterium]